jgi:acyl dehydratase
LATFADIENLQSGDTAACELEVTAEHLEAFARLSLDCNPLHMDDAVAQEYGFPSRVVHGMVALAAISRLIGTQLPGPGSLWIAQDVQFAVPVLVGDRLEAQVTVQNVSRATQVVTLATEVVKSGSGAVVLRGTAKVRIPQRRSEVPA